MKVNGDNMVLAIKIDEEVMKDDAEMLQDLVMTATNEAIKTAKDVSSKEMEKITGGFNMPGMF